MTGESQAIVTTDRYRIQHAQLMRIILELGNCLASRQLASDATRVRGLLEEFSKKLAVHLAAEDNLLYPRLLGAADAQTREVAQRFQSEMGEMRNLLKGYARRWLKFRGIESNPEEFAAESRELLEATMRRIRRENAELYPLADRTRATADRPHHA